MNSRAYSHPSQQPHPHQQTHQPHQAQHTGSHPVAPYAAALQGQIGHRPVFQQPNSQNAAPQAGAAAGSGAAGPGSSAGQMMHPSGGQMVQNQANQPQPQSYQNVPPQQAIRTAFGSQQPVAQNRPQTQMHQSQQQQQQAQNAVAAAAAMQQHVVMFQPGPGYGQHMVQHMYPANAGPPQPVMSIPSHLQAISQYQTYPRMPFQAATSQPQMLNYLPHGYAAHNYAFGQPAYVPPQQQQHGQQQHPQQQQQGPPRGHPIPSPSPVNAGMVIQVHESGAKAPSHTPNASAPIFKPREKKCAVIQDPTTLEVVDLGKPDPPAATATSQRSTPSVDSVKAEPAAELPVPEPAKTLPNVSFSSLTSPSLTHFHPQNTPTATIAVDFMNKVALAASEPIKTSTDPEPVPPVKSEPEPIPVPATRPAADKPSLKPSNRDAEVKPVVTVVVAETAKKEEEEAKAEAEAPSDAKENVTPASDKTPAPVVKTGPRHVEPKSKAVVTETPTSTSTTGPALKPVTAQNTPPARVESEPDSASEKSSHVPASSKTPPASCTPPVETIEAAAEPIVTKVNGEIPQPPEEVAPVVADAAASPVVEVAPVVPVAKPAAADDASRSKTEKGVFRYSRDELVEFSKLPVCHTRPAELTDDKLLRMRGVAGRGPTGPGQVDFMPSFMSQGPRGSGARSGSSSRPIYPGRPSQEMRGPPKKIIPSASLNQDVKLHTVENAWKPEVGAKKPVESGQDEEAKTVLLLKNFRGFLNKITPQKYDVIEGKIKELTIDTEDRLEKVLNLVFDKAVDEPAFCKQYAQLCQHLGSRHVTKLVVNKEGQEVEEKVEFRRLLIQKCQQEFERDIYEGIDVVGRMEDIEECINEEKKRQLEHELEEEKRRARLKSLGNMKLIGELYRLQMLKAVIMVNCIHKLISEIEDDNLECLCTLLRTIGQQLEIETQDKQNSDVLGKYFTRLNTIVNSPELGKTISVRVKCLIKDILDLKSNKWQGRGIHKENVPKTIDQIHKEVQIDAEKNRQEDLDYQQSRGDQRRGRPYGGQSYGSRSLQGNQHYEKDISSVLASLKATQKKPENETMTLGPSAMGMWGQGSTGKALSQAVPPAPSSQSSQQEGSRYASGAGREGGQDRNAAGKSRSQILPQQQSGRKPEAKDLSRQIATEPLKSGSPFVNPAGVRGRSSSADNNRSMPSSRSSSKGVSTVDSPQPVRKVPEVSPTRGRKKADEENE